MIAKSKPSARIKRRTSPASGRKITFYEVETYQPGSRKKPEVRCRVFDRSLADAWADTFNQCGGPTLVATVFVVTATVETRKAAKP